ncbi:MULTISPECIES: diacylglycerol kinase family protein [unclassified Nocardioides]|uniref:diacylglycerol/lipid kinase family protein n=1 Tax=unclassified Nocardioides TaxID=2615069 RepID=UPI00116D0764|nr:MULTISPECIES: diacylglycerol kinase family protein [unclassified Nocardioides]TQK69298.1 YegS/Rv2252/BmrU family lipid kinase [Nocardioides sp. SLBN-35]WGY01399.1 diacylglycerol kinase family protein [Nocardioides sp. QY071]
MATRLLLITNGEAGTADREAVDAALAVLREGAEVEVAATSSEDELDDVLEDAGDRRIVVAGGDGSIHAVVQALHSRGDLAGRELALVPLGTGNDFARTLGLPLEPEEAARVVLAGTPRPTDLVVDEDGQVTVNSVHLGAGAEAGKRGARWKERLGRVGYPIGALQTAINPPSLRVRVEVDGEVVVDVDQPVLMVAVGNGASVGGGTELTPDAEPHDGEVDVLIATPRGPLARLGYLVRLPFARHEEHRDVRILRGRTVRVSGTAFECNSDGEIDGPVRSRTWRVQPAAYAMVVPHL